MAPTTSNCLAQSHHVSTHVSTLRPCLDSLNSSQLKTPLCFKTSDYLVSSWCLLCEVCSSRCSHSVCICLASFDSLSMIHHTLNKYGNIDVSFYGWAFSLLQRKGAWSQCCPKSNVQLHQSNHIPPASCLHCVSTNQLNDKDTQ